MSDGPNRVQLLSDDFSSYETCEKLTGLDEPERLGPWEQTTLHYSWRSERIQGYRDCRLPWRIVDIGGRRFLDQPESFHNVVLAAGDPLWRDYQLELDLAVSDGPAGPIVRYHTSRQNYWIAFQAGRPVELFRRDGDDHVLLGASIGLAIEAGRVYSCRVTCCASRISVAVDGREVISVIDGRYGSGKIGLRTEGPARFASVTVTGEPCEVDSVRSARCRRADRIRRLRESLPGPKLLHSVELPDDFSLLHICDVNDDGRAEILALDIHVPKQDYLHLGRLSVFDMDGKLLWRRGEKQESKFAVHGDVALNVADIDGDGRTEILTTQNFEILIMDGATGEVKASAPTPLTYKGREDLYPRTVGDSFLVCNLRGLDGARDFVLKDRYCNVWAYTCELEPLWHRALNTGHYPRARDINGDGRDEVLAGYSMLDADGNTLWAVPGGDPLKNRYPGPEHCDSMLIERFDTDPDAPLQIALAASDLGFLLLDVAGNVLARDRVGHAQSLGAGRFRPDLPGRQFLVRTFWGNTKIQALYDGDGHLLTSGESESAAGEDLGGGHRTVPVHWTGDGRCLILGADSLMDGNFDSLVPLPAGKQVRPYAYDVNGDGIDEIFLLTGRTVQVYGPESIPADPVRLPRPSLTNWNVYGGFFR